MDPDDTTHARPGEDGSECVLAQDMAAHRAVTNATEDALVALLSVTKETEQFLLWLSRKTAATESESEMLRARARILSAAILACYESVA